MKCSVCSNEIKGKYCSHCGQTYYEGKKVNSITLLGDLLNSIFSLEKSFLINMKVGLIEPKKLVSNYWNGFRRYYYSPGKFFTIASALLVLHYLFVDDFLGLVVKSNISLQFAIFLVNILLLTFSSYLLYIQFKRNFYEHLVLNIYNLSLWIIIFSPISVILSLTINDNSIEQYLYIPFHVLIIIWNSKAFELTKLKRFVFVILNFILVYGALFLIALKSGGF